MTSNLFTHLNMHQTNQQVGHDIIGAPLVLRRAIGDHRRPRTHKTHHGLDSGEATTFPHIVLFAPLHEAYIQMTFCPRTPKGGFRNCQGLDTCNFAGLQFRVQTSDRNEV